MWISHSGQRVVLSGGNEVLRAGTIYFLLGKRSKCNFTKNRR